MAVQNCSLSKFKPIADKAYASGAVRQREPPASCYRQDNRQRATRTFTTDLRHAGEWWPTLPLPKWCNFRLGGDSPEALQLGYSDRTWSGKRANESIPTFRASAR